MTPDYEGRFEVGWGVEFLIRVLILAVVIGTGRDGEVKRRSTGGTKFDGEVSGMYLGLT